ncbi:DnaT-like ssDNA-binding protein [Myxococcus eversor]|uniref:DnaT-like ssDNA-binding protein n=1 Tax=Myxococcus eversor TaxID=2709661 RepID=UPI0013D2596F|nr:DnaT-like ssDNA-binding protein [Myxococcus eversor]
MPIDATPGGPAADSYCTLVEADAYHSARAHNAAWESATVEQKERHLKWATSLLDTHFQYLGARVSDAQALAWPRRGVRLDGVDVSPLTVPLRLRGAVAEFAFRLMPEDWTAGLGPVVDQGVQVGPLKTTAETHVPIPAQVAQMLAPLVRPRPAGIGSLQVVRG